MQLQCEQEGATAGVGTGLGATWLPPDTLESLAEVNESCLSLLAEQLQGATHLVYAALYEKPGLIGGWRERSESHAAVDTCRSRTSSAA